MKYRVHYFGWFSTIVEAPRDDIVEICRQAYRSGLCPQTYEEMMGNTYYDMEEDGCPINDANVKDWIAEHYLSFMDDDGEMAYVDLYRFQYTPVPPNTKLGGTLSSQKPKMMRYKGIVR